MCLAFNSLLTQCLNCCGVACAAAPESATGSSALDELAFNKKPRPVEFEPYKMVRQLQ
jgi:hypothetical protein